VGRHRVLCGDARDKEAYGLLLANERADLIFTDPPYNVPIEGHVCGSGRIAMGVGEMSSEAFTEFLGQTLGAAASTCRNGAIAFVCMDWRHVSELLAAGNGVFSRGEGSCMIPRTRSHDFCCA
jgi:hypothetical protein